MKLPFHQTPWLALALAAIVSTARAAEEPTPIGNFGPTGLSVTIDRDRTLKVLGTAPNSPAAGKFSAGQVIAAINGKPPVQPAEEGAEPFADFKRLASFITDAEARDGVLRFDVRSGNAAQGQEVVVNIPVLGAYAKTAPINCDKTRKIIRANADYIASVAGANGAGLAEHNLYNGWAILMLLSTGEEKDLDVVRAVYRHRMASFQGKDTGPHSWHNGLQGIAVCEYYLRTGDESVMPLINAICESARKYEVQGGWTHWAQGVNPQYTAGGLMNPAGTQILTTLLLARQCGANVSDKTLADSLRFFYRFAGHGSNPYGDHRPEGGYGSNNGKTEMLALSMNVASRAQNGELYAAARDKSALTALYDYPNMLQGHTGGLGALWYGLAAGLMAEKKPELYANWVEQTRWFYELSRRHTGAFGASGSGRYDDEKFGYAVGLHLTSPLKTLQITGAPKSPHAKTFALPARPWGREADVAFFSLDGGKAYQATNVPPHVELAQIRTADEAALERFASHPEHVYREVAAQAIREKKLLRLVEKLLRSSDPLARHTACMTINGYEPWGLRFSIGTRSRYSLAPDEFSPEMFEGVMAILNDPAQPLWNVDNALLALAAASGEQVKSQLDELLPWLDHAEWWLNESACIALTPAMKDPEALRKILPRLTVSLARNMHARPRSTMSFMMERAVADADPEAKRLMADAFVEVYRKTPTIPSPEPGVDHSGITSVALQGTLSTALSTADKARIPEIAQLTVERLGDMRDRERNEQIDMLIQTASRLDPPARKRLGDILVQHYRRSVVGENPAGLLADMKAGKAVNEMNTLLAIDEMAGVPGGWKVLGTDPAGTQSWWFTTFEPAEKPHESEQNRYRQIALPPTLADWYKPDYDPSQHGWTLEKGSHFIGSTPDSLGASQRWVKEHLPKAGEVVLLRKTFELDDLEQARIRLTVYARQGFDVYLNGQRIVSNKNRSKTMGAQRYYLDDKMRQHLKPGTNVIAAMSFLQYFRGKDGSIDVYVESLKELPRVE